MPQLPPSRSRFHWRTFLPVVVAPLMLVKSAFAFQDSPPPVPPTPPTPPVIIESIPATQSSGSAVIIRGNRGTPQSIVIHGNSSTATATATSVVTGSTTSASASTTAGDKKKKKDAEKRAAEKAKKAEKSNDGKSDGEKKATSDKGNQAKEAAATKRLKSIESKLEKLTQQMELLGKQKAAAQEKAAEKSAKAAEKEAAESKSEPEAAKAESAPAAPAVADRGKLPPKTSLDDSWLSTIPARSLGPANMSGRITDIDIHPSDSSQWYIGTAGGGLLKSSNHGVSLSHHFDDQTSVSIGAVASDPQNKDVVWIGTGEANPRNSVSYGDGVYKSNDGGETYEHMGLKETFQIARILVDPKDSNTVYVGACGRLYGTNRERGVYKTTDGGKTWEHSLYVDDQTGVIDMIMHPKDPNTIIAAMWNRKRDEFDSWPGSVKKPDGVDGYDPIRKYGPGGGLYKTTDGGKNWKKLTDGLPTSSTGRIGLDWQSGADNAIVAIIDCEMIGKGPKPFDTFLGLVGTDRKSKDKSQPVVTQLMPESPAEKAGVKVGDVLTEVDGKAVKKFDELLDVLREKKIGQKLSFTVTRDGESKTFETRLSPRPGSNQQMPTVWLGVTGETTEDGKPKLLTISKGGPAEKAKLKAGDIITKIDDADAKSYEDLIKLVQGSEDGKKIKVEVLRGEETVAVDVTLANRPARGTPARSNAIMGIQGTNADEGEGAKLTSITDKGPSEKAGLKSGDVVIKIDDKKVANYEALIGEIRSRQPDDEMKVVVKRGDKEITKTVTLGDRRGSSGDRPYTYSYYGQQPNVQDMQGADGHLYGGIYKSTDAGETWERVNSLNTRPMYFSVIRIDPGNSERIYVLGVSQFQSKDGGRTFSADFGRSVHADGHDLWIDPADGRHMVIAGDGGFYVTYDYGSRWDHVNTVAIGQFYHAAISPKKPYWVVGGLQDNGTWAGPAISRNGGAVIQDWINVSGGDGFVARVDETDPDLMYYESQNGNIGRRNIATGERASIRPGREQGVETRFNWNTPFILSNHNPQIFYSAGNYVYRSLNKGSNLKRISPEVTRTKRGSATALSESPRNSDVLYVGTDDGLLWVTKDGGNNWTDITANLGIDGHRWVNTIEASRYATGRVYVVLDAHRSDDDNPYVFVSEDYGSTFTPLHKDLPWGTSRCLREDIRNENLLYLGTENGFYVSIDRGQSWSKFNQNVPVVAIHDVALHPSVNEIVLATHGRSLWAVDVSALRTVKAEEVGKKAIFYSPEDVVRWRTQPSRGRTNRRYVATNPPRGAVLYYSLPEKVKTVQLKIEDIQGQTVNTLTGKTEAGLQRIDWNLSRAARRSTGRASSGFRGTGFGRIVGNGSYKATLIVDGKDVQSHVFEVESDPGLAPGATSDEEYETMLLQDEMKSKLKWDAKSEGRDVYQDD